MHWECGAGQNHESSIGDDRKHPIYSPFGHHEEIQKLPWLIPTSPRRRPSQNVDPRADVETPRTGSWSIPGLHDKEGRKVPTWITGKIQFLETMTSAGFAPDSIDTVLCNHLHVDQSLEHKTRQRQMGAYFANARYVFGKAEYQHWRDHSDEPDKVAVFNDSVSRSSTPGKAELIASDASSATKSP